MVDTINIYIYMMHDQLTTYNVTTKQVLFLN